MYRIHVINNSTDAQWMEYGFSRYMMKRINYLFNAQKSDSFELQYDIMEITKLVLTFSTFKKCLFGTVYEVKKA